MPTEQRLNQVIAVEHGLRSRIETDRTGLYHTLQKTALFDGMKRTYRPINDDGDKMPAENRKVQQRAADLLEEAVERMVELFDITATKDWANCNARADVVLDGEVLIKQAPTTFLLYLEKELINVRTILDKLPILDPAETWSQDQNDSLWKSAEIEKVRTQKTAKAIVLHPPTKEHPAQTQLVPEDVNVGFWTEQKLSGAFPLAEQKRYLAKVEKLQIAVKTAREEANMTAAPQQEVGARLFQWLFT